MSVHSHDGPLLNKLSAAELVERYRRWLQHYRVDQDRGAESNAWLLLLHLISDFEPPSPKVVIPKRRRGHPYQWNLSYEIALVSSVEEKLKAGLTAKEACRKLIKSKPWSTWSTGDARGRHLSAASLERRYYRLINVRPDLKNAGTLELFEAVATDAPSALSRRVS